MSHIVKSGEVEELVAFILKDYEEEKIIDKIDMFNKPNKAEVIDLINEFFQIIYPGYFRDKSFKIYNFRNNFALLMEDSFYHLNKQVMRALSYDEEKRENVEEESYNIVKSFFAQIPKIRQYMEWDLQAALDGDPAAESVEELILSYPGIRAITVYRLAHELYIRKVPVLPRLMTEYAHSETGIDIHPGAIIGKRFFIDHGTGIVIGQTAEIGDNVKIYQGVTIGALSTSQGRGLSNVKRHPTIEDHVTIYAGATVLGGETVIGKNVTIKGNAFITESVKSLSKE